MPRTGDIGFMSVHACVHPSRIGVVLCVRDSAQTASHIYTHLMPINCTIIVDVQHTFHFDLDLISDSGKGHKNLVFLHTLYKMGGTLCARLSPNRFTYLHILGANQCATYLSFLPWLYFRSRTRSHKLCFPAYFIEDGWYLCAWLSPNHLTYFHIIGANQLYNHCRCATYL